MATQASRSDVQCICSDLPYRSSTWSRALARFSNDPYRVGQRRQRETGRAAVRPRRHQWFGTRRVSSIAVTPATRFCHPDFDIALARRVARGTSQEPSTEHSRISRYRRTAGKACAQPGAAQQGLPRPLSMDLSRDGQWPPGRFADQQSGAASLRLDAHTACCFQLPLPPLQIPQFLRIPLCPGEEIDKIRRILSR